MILSEYFHIFSVFESPFFSMRYVYMLRCSDDTLYTGITTDLQKRINEHNTDSKGAAYTAARRPVTLVRSCEASSRSAASKLERQIKHLTKSQKLAMIDERRQT